MRDPLDKLMARIGRATGLPTFETDGAIGVTRQARPDSFVGSRRSVASPVDSKEA